MHLVTSLASFNSLDSLQVPLFKRKQQTPVSNRISLSGSKGVCLHPWGSKLQPYSFQVEGDDGKSGAPCRSRSKPLVANTDQLNKVHFFLFLGWFPHEKRHLLDWLLQSLGVRRQLQFVVSLQGNTSMGGPLKSVFSCRKSRNLEEQN